MNNLFNVFNGLMPVKAPSDFNYTMTRLKRGMLAVLPTEIVVLILSQLSIKDLDGFYKTCRRFSRLCLDSRMPSISSIRELYALLRNEPHITCLTCESGKFSIRSSDFLKEQFVSSTFLYSSFILNITDDGITKRKEIIIGRIGTDLPDMQKQALQIAVAKLNRRFLGDSSNLSWQDEIKLCENAYMMKKNHGSSITS